MKILVDLFDRALVALGLARPRTLFDADHYLAAYPDVAAAGVDPYRHYLDHGVAEGRAPNAFFDTRHYLAQTRDRPRDPTRHYLLFGAAAGLDPHPAFETRWYLARYEDVARSGINPLRHYLVHGHAEGRETAPRFRRAFARIDGFTRDPARLGFRRFVFGPGAAVVEAEHRDRHVVLARLADGPRRAVATVAEAAAGGWGPEVSIETTAPDGAATADPTIALVFSDCFVAAIGDEIRVDHAEMRVFFVDAAEVRPICVVPGGSFRGLGRSGANSP